MGKGERSFIHHRKVRFYKDSPWAPVPPKIIATPFLPDYCEVKLEKKSFVENERLRFKKNPVFLDQTWWTWMTISYCDTSTMQFYVRVGLGSTLANLSQGNNNNTILFSSSSKWILSSVLRVLRSTYVYCSKKGNQSESPFNMVIIGINTVR